MSHTLCKTFWKEMVHHSQRVNIHAHVHVHEHVAAGATAMLCYAINAGVFCYERQLGNLSGELIKNIDDRNQNVVKTAN